MAQAYNVVAALNQMQQAKKDRQDSALKRMMVAQEWQMQQINLAGQQLQMLHTVNTQMMGDEAKQFLADTGLSALYEKYGVDKATEAVKELSYERGSGWGWGKSPYGAEMGENEAAVLYSAVVQAHAGGNFKPILEIGSELHDAQLSALSGIDDPKGNSLVKSFLNMGYGSDKHFKRLRSMKKVLQNAFDINAEMMEYGKGDYKIERDIGMPSLKAASALLATTKDPIVSDPYTQYKKVLEQEKGINDQIDLKNNALNILDQESVSLEILNERDELTDEQRAYFLEIPELREILNEDLISLSEELKKLQELEDAFAAVSPQVAAQRSDFEIESKRIAEEEAYKKASKRLEFLAPTGYLDPF